MPQELTAKQTDELRETLVELREHLRELLDVTRDDTKPVDLNLPIGRLSRIDAIQQQKMAQASRSSLDIRLRQVEAAIKRFDDETYGFCALCDDDIGFSRLKAKPETPYCIDCQSGREEG